MKRLDIEQKTPEWKDLRRNSLGASDAPVIMGISPYKTPRKLWGEKLGFVDIPEPTEAMNKGNYLEIVARDHFNSVYKDTMEPAVVQHSEYPYLIASLDGMNMMDDFIEIKYNREAVHDEVCTSGTIPNFHMCQMQHQFLVTGKNTAHYISINSKHEVMIIKVERDNSYIEDLIRALKRFWGAILKFEEPPAVDRDYVERQDPTWFEIAIEYIKVKKQLDVYDSLKKKEEELRKKLIIESNGKNSVGGGVKLTKFIKKGSIDMDKICSELGIDSEKLETCRKNETETWRVGLM